MSPGARFRQAVKEERPLQVIGTICAYHARLAQRTGYKAVYLSGGGVAAGSLGMPDLGISNLDDVLIDVRRITDVCELPLLVDSDTGFGASAFNVARTVRSLIKAGAGAMHIEDQVGAKRCGHRPGKELVSAGEMGDRIKAAVDARTDPHFVVMARTDAPGGRRARRGPRRAQWRYVEAGADMIFPEAITELAHVPEVRRRREGTRCSRTSPSSARRRCSRSTSCARRGVAIALYPLSAFRAMNKAALDVYSAMRRRGHAEGRRRHHADPRRAVRLPRLPRLREETR